jgi:TonB family protein
MGIGAKRRIRGREKGAKSESVPRTPFMEGGMRLPVMVALSVGVHILFLAAVMYLPGLLPKSEQPVKLYSVTVINLPKGPAGGGGKEPEKVKPPPKPVKTPEEKKPEEKPVKIAAKTKPKKAEPQKAPEKEPQPKKPVASIGPGQGPVGGGKEGKEVEGPITLEVGVEFPYKEYLFALESKVKRRWNAPRVQTGSKPKVILFFWVDRMGRVSGIKVEQSSGIGIVDRSALSALTEASPFEPLPEGFEGDRLGVHYTFVVGE